MVGDMLSRRLEARRDGARATFRGATDNVKALLGDLKGRIDLSESKPKSLLVDVPKDAMQRTMAFISDAEKRFASNNRKGFGR